MLINRVENRVDRSSATVSPANHLGDMDSSAQYLYYVLEHYHSAGPKFVLPHRQPRLIRGENDFRLGILPHVQRSRQEERKSRRRGTGLITGNEMDAWPSMEATKGRTSKTKR